MKKKTYRDSALTQKRLQEVLDYNPETGIFTWKAPTKQQWNQKIGAEAGSYDQKGYRKIMVDRVRVTSHVLAWMYVYGVWPSAHVDHINMVKDDNRIANLREANDSQNKANCPAYKNNPTGLKGAYWYPKTQTWVSKIRKDNKLVHLGAFQTAEQAHEAYSNAVRNYHGEFARAR
jgi:hypothetical protein